MAADHASAAARDATRRRVSAQLEKTAMVRYAAERFITNARRASSSSADAMDGAAPGETSGASWNVHDGTWSGRAQAAAAHGLAVGDKLFRAYAPARFRLLRMGALILCVYLFGVFHFHWLWAVGVVALAVDAERLFVMHQVRTMVRTKLQEEEHRRRMGIMQKKMFPDHESAFWLNRVLQISWRGWLGCILTSTMHETVTPILKASMPGVVSDIGFERVDFGRNAPELGNLHMYDRVEENVAEFDFDLKLNSDLELILFAKVSKVKVPIRISDLELNARLRATISFIDDFPFAGNINLCLINRPYVDITVAPLKKLNLMGLPGVSSWLKEMVTDVLVDMLQWPNSFDVDLCNAMLGEPYDPNAVLMGKVTVGILHVHIIEARNLVAADTRRVGSKVLKLKPTSDPFCVSRIHGHRRKTKTHKRTTNPKFDERYEFKVMNHKMRIFQMEVFDWDMHGKNDSLGTIDIDVHELVPNTGLDCWIDLKGAEHGEVHIELMYEEYEEIANTAATAGDGDAAAKDSAPEKPEPTYESMLKSELTAFRSVRPSLSMGGGASGGAGGSGDSDRKGIVEVTVVRAEDLVAADRGGTSDPYVKLRLGTQQYKTAYKKKTLNPEWGEHFDFSIHNSATQVIEIEVWDHDRLSDDLIGKYSLPISDIQEGRQELDVQLTGVPHGKLFLVVSRRSFKSPKKAKKTERKTPASGGASSGGGSGGDPSPDAGDAFAQAANAFSVAMGSASPNTTPADAAGDAPTVLALGRELSGTLTIKVKSARELIAADRNGTSDPYTKIKLVSERGVTKVRTQVKKKTLSPVWNETFQLDVFDALHDIVRVEVMDYDRVGTNDSIGHAVIKLHEHVSAEHPELPLTAMEVPLRGVESGVVLLDVAFERPKDIVSAVPAQPTTAPSEPVAVGAPPSPMVPGTAVLTDSDESGESDDAGAVSDALSNVSAPSSAAASPLRNKHLAVAGGAGAGARLKPHMSEVGFGVQSLGSGSDSDSSPDRGDMTRPASMMNLPAVRTPTQHALEKKKDSFVRTSKSKHRAGAIGVLQVVVKSARNLLAFNSGGTSDPYVVLNVNGHQESKTKKHSKTVAPLFNETCHFFIHNTDEVLTARVLNYNRFTADDVLGVMRYQTSGTNLDSETAFFTLQEVESGELELTITYYSLS